MTIPKNINWTNLTIAAAGVLITLLTLWSFFVSPIEARVTRLEQDQVAERDRTEEVLRRIEDKLDNVSEMVQRLDERTKP